MYQRITTSLHYRSLLEPLVIYPLRGSKSKTLTSYCACMSSVGCDKALFYKWLHKAHSLVLRYFFFSNTRHLFYIRLYNLAGPYGLIIGKPSDS
ncbi:hypothetical protein VNO77_19062 [Canavalia gladiata]|uniref:Uncharacterized protein n=1 Tax=Canavalia gladiata TaxID=3824 RepID=A0AAN9LQV9_CANGL